MTTLLVALGGAVGAALRFWLAARLDGAWPRGVLLVNVTGSLLLGVLVGAGVDGAALALLGAGFCGGLTTWSTFAVQAVDQGRGRGAAYVAVTVTLSIAAAAAGWALAQA